MADEKPKPWTKLTSGEKIEILWERVKRLQRIARDAENKEFRRTHKSYSDKNFRVDYGD